MITMKQRGVTVWLTGLSGAGKSTITEALQAKLIAEGYSIEVLDGDIVRTNLTKGLGFSKEDRDENIRRIGFVSNLLTRHGVRFRDFRGKCRQSLEQIDGIRLHSSSCGGLIA